MGTRSNYHRSQSNQDLGTRPMASQRLCELLQETSSEVPYAQVMALLREGANPCSQFGRTRQSALFLSVERNDETLLDLLLSHSEKKDLGAANAGGLNALMLAAKHGYCGCVHLLLLAGFNAQQLLDEQSGSSHLRSTALILACSGGHTEAVKSLLEAGANPNLCDSKGRAPVHLCAVQGNLELLQELKDHGALLSGVTDNQGNTPMHFCTHPQIVEYLYHEGISPGIRNHQGSTPLDLLQRMHTDSVVTLLQQLQEDEQRRNNVARVGKLAQCLSQLVNDVCRDLGWKTVLMVVVIVLIVAWNVTVYLHGQSPFHSRTNFQQ